jgi:hypothetical protein
MSADTVLALAAALASTGFTIDLLVDLRRKFRPHTAAYAAGIAMFAIATWALWVGLTFGWDAGCSGVDPNCGPVYRAFFLFGAVLNIPVLALGSMFLVAGKRAGHVMTILLGAFTAISVTLVTTVPFAQPLPESGVPSQIFPPISEGFGPRMLAAIGSGLGTILLIGLGLASVVRFWKKNRRIVWGNALIVAGVFAAAAGGTQLGFLNATQTFELSLLLAATLIWAGYRVTRGARSAPPAPAPGGGPAS